MKIAKIVTKKDWTAFITAEKKPRVYLYNCDTFWDGEDFDAKEIKASDITDTKQIEWMINTQVFPLALFKKISKAL